MKIVLLCGGSGKRLWPLSRRLYPKQFLPLFNNVSLFQKTILRSVELSSEIIIVTNTDHQFLAESQIEALNLPKSVSFTWILEAAPKNTAPAIAFASFISQPDDVLLVCPCDHLIKGDFNTPARNAEKAAKENKITTIGITPTRPETGYGYIHIDKTSQPNNVFFQVESFKEKPRLETAQEWIKKGNYYWNSGIFCFTAKRYLDALEKHSPYMFEQSKNAIENANRHKCYIDIKKEDNADIPDDSIDYAVLENETDIAMVSGKDMAWNDAGSFDSLMDENASMNLENKTFNHVSVNSKNISILNASRQITSVGIEDLIIVDTDDALMICKKGESQLLKEATKEIALVTPTLIETHTRTYRPWGYFDLLREEPGFKVKKIHVYPHKRLSLQKHEHRSENWVVVEGRATVVRNEETFELDKKESISIRKGDLHRLENNTDAPLSIIETQTGPYLGEDDIIRIQDDFKRH